MYRDAHAPRRERSGLCYCTVIAKTGTTLLLQDIRGGSSTAIQVSIPADSDIEVGDTVFVAGDEAGGVISPFGMRRALREREHASRHWFW
jgi:hypothetical protein